MEGGGTTEQEIHKQFRELVSESRKKHEMNDDKVAKNVQKLAGYTFLQQRVEVQKHLDLSVIRGIPSKEWAGEEESTIDWLETAERSFIQIPAEQQADALYESNRRALQDESAGGFPESTLPEGKRERLRLTRNRTQMLARAMDLVGIDRKPLPEYKLADI